MSFFRKDYSAYPQPVIVRPDPRYGEESLSEAVAEAIDTEHTSQYEANISAGATATSASTDSNKSTRDEDPSEELQQRDTQNESSSQMTTAQESQQQKDTAKLADGIMSLLGPIVQEMDFNIVSVRKSQTELEKEIERLMAELQLFMESSAAPPEVEPAVQKLLKARRQIMTANSTLKTVQDRVDKMHLQMSRRQ
ncbi:hypothetical protein BGZ46_006291 [Entomortierella lignicola]|nr:hypothetical protein BGZ46_006291 [Entomortierella lignicola]